MPANNPVHKPTEVPRWGDDATSAVAPVQTPSAEVEPTEGKKSAGFVPGEKPAAQHLNWLLFWLYWWVLWLQDIANLNFTDTGAQPIGPWTGPHKYVGGNGTPTILVINGGTSGEAGIDAQGDAGGPLQNPGAGVIGRGGTPHDDSLGADGLQGYGSGGVGRGAYLQGGSGATSGGAGAEAHGGAGASGADLYGGATPSGGGSPGKGFTATGGAGGGDGGYVQGDTTVGATANGLTSIGYGTGSGCIGITLGSGPAVQGQSLGTGAGGYFASSTGGVALFASSSYAQYALRVQMTGAALGVYVTSTSATFAAMEIDSAADGLVVNTTASGKAALVLSAASRLDRAIRVSNGVITWSGTLPLASEVPPTRSLSPLNGVVAWGSCLTVTGSRYAAWALIEGADGAGFSYNSGTKTITFSWGTALATDVDGNAWPNISIQTEFGHLHTITSTTATSVSFQLTTTPNGAAVDATALGQRIMVNVVGRPA